MAVEGVHGEGLVIGEDHLVPHAEVGGVLHQKVHGLPPIGGIRLHRDDVVHRLHGFILHNHTPHLADIGGGLGGHIGHGLGLLGDIGGGLDGDPDGNIGLGQGLSDGHAVKVGPAFLKGIL